MRTKSGDDKVSRPGRHTSCILNDASLPGKPTWNEQFRVGLPVSRRLPGLQELGRKFR